MLHRTDISQLLQDSGYESGGRRCHRAYQSIRPRMGMAGRSR
ncbi:hypothetical protein [Acinetobacter baumannii]|nr:hypothetical protein [Acinetobacter baumannii]